MTAAAFDQDVMRAVARHRTEWLDYVSGHVMVAGTNPRWVALYAVVAVIAVLVTRAYRVALAVVLAVVIASVATALLKAVLERPRPPADLSLVHASGSAMPSSEAARTAAAALALFLVVAWRDERVRAIAGGVLAAALVFVAACMVYLGAHWPSDVLAGWAIGVAAGLVAVRLTRGSFGPGTAAPAPRSAPTG